jgi:hypothetical protein
LHRTWARVGCQPSIDTYGQRRTAHLYGTIGLKDASFTYWFADVFNGHTFWAFLKRLVRKYDGRKIFLIIDNAPWHNLPSEGKQWLGSNRGKIVLFRLPTCSPELNPMEPVWKATRKLATHNQFFVDAQQRDAALRNAFAMFQRRPSLIAAHVARLQ